MALSPLAMQLINNMGQMPANAMSANQADQGVNSVNQAVMGMLLNKARQQQGAAPASFPGLANIGANLQAAGNWVNGLFGGSSSGQ